MCADGVSGASERLRNFRMQRGLTQQEVADELARLAWQTRRENVGVDRGMVSKWERGCKRPSRLYRALFCSLYGVDEVQLGFRPEPEYPAVPVAEEAAVVAGSDEEDMNRREWLRQAGGLTALAALAPWERLAQALREPVAADAGIVDNVAKTNAALFGLEEHLPARQLAVRVSRHLEFTTNLLGSSMPSARRRALLSAAGEAATLGGWLAFDMNDLRAAGGYYRVATQVAKEAGDGALLGCVLGYSSYAASREGDHARARDLLAEAADQAVRSGDAGSHAWLAGRMAEECALLGDETTAMRAMEEAWLGFEKSAGATQRVWTRFFDRSRLGGMQAASLLVLRRTRDASSAAEAAVAALVPSQQKKRAIALTDVAAVRVQEGELEAAGRLAAEALEIAGRTESRVAMRRLLGLREPVAAAGAERTLRELDARLKSTGARSLL